MHETATLHFDLSHLSVDQPFVLRAGAARYDLVPHTRQTLARSRRDNAALALLPEHRVTHFAGPVRLPTDALLLLRVTAPALRPDDLLDRLVLTSLQVPRGHRIAGLARRRQRPQGRPSHAKLAAYDLTDGGTGLPPDDKIIIDIGDLHTATDAAASLIFHHAELLATQKPKADYIVSEVIYYAAGMNALAQSILDESQAHERDPAEPNWVSSQPGKDWKTGQPAKPIYVWSDRTREYLRLPLGDALKQAKDDSNLENQCWTVQPGVTQVPLTLVPAASPGDAAGATYTVKEVTPQSGVEHRFGYDPSTAAATVSLKNYYLRWLQISVDQYGPGGEKVGQLQTLGPLSPVDTIMSVPLAPDWSDFRFTFDEKASRAAVNFGGLGQAPFSWPHDGAGIILTSVFNYAIPMMFISLGVAVDQGGTGWSDLAKNVAGKVLAATEAADEGPIASATGGGVGLEDVMLAIMNCAGSLLLAAIAGSDQLKAYIAAAIGQSAAEEAAPFLGWVADAIGAAADVASMIQTSVEVATSPATMSISIERSMDVTVTVDPDPDHQGQWPATATHYTITITYDDGPVHSYDGQLAPTTQQGPITHTFAGLPAGGTLTVLASFYAATGWLAGQGVSAPLAAQPAQGSTLVVPAFAIKENLVPLSAATTYTLKEKLAFQSGGRVWRAPPAIAAPTATVSDLNASNVGTNLGQLGQLALNEAASVLGYSWEASGQGAPLVNTGNQPYTGQEFTFQAISDAAAPQSGLKFSGDGYIAQPCLAFPPPTMANPLAQGFLLEPHTADDTMFLRAVSLQPNQPMITSPGQSFGRFTGPQDDLAIHPAGYAVALNTATCKLQMVRITGLTGDAGAPVAAILAGQGSRPGLLANPVAVSCSLDTIVVLQTSEDHPQGCICAFDVKGNPVNCFAGKSSVASLRPEGAATVTLVDLSVESKGYLYILKYLASASGSVLASDYRLDICNPDGTFLAQVAGLAAARLQVDLWRNLFTLNYEILPGSGRTEPSVASWIPSTPGA